MVARAVSPTSAATSTRFAAATMNDLSAAPLRRASNDSSAAAEPMGGDIRFFRCENACGPDRRHAGMREYHEATVNSRRAADQLRGGAQGADRDGDAMRRSHFRIEHSALRSGNRRDQALPGGTADRNRARPDEGV